MSLTSAARTRTVPTWVVLGTDGVLVLAFAAVGRRSHGETGALLGVLGTAWPFLVGLAAGWSIGYLTGGGRRGRAEGLGFGVLVWVATVAGGMALRALTGQGVALSFVVVASIVTGLLLLGWRLVVAAAGRARAR